jgi:Domain of unknown function (DUF4430)
MSVLPILQSKSFCQQQPIPIFQENIFMATVQVSISGGPTVTVPWSQNMNAQQALEDAYNQLNNNGFFTYAIQYYGAALGYMVVMINETYDTFISSAAPYFYWEFLVNSAPASNGIDGVTLNPGDIISFQLEMYSPAQHAATTVGKKHAFQLSAASVRPA